MRRNYSRFLQKCAKVAWQWNAIFKSWKLKEIKGKEKRGMEGVTGGEGKKEDSLEVYAWGGSFKSKAEINIFSGKQNEEVNFQRTYTWRRNNQNSWGKISPIPERNLTLHKEMKIARNKQLWMIKSILLLWITKHISNTNIICIIILFKCFIISHNVFCIFSRMIIISWEQETGKMYVILMFIHKSIQYYLEIGSDLIN